MTGRHHRTASLHVVVLFLTCCEDKRLQFRCLQSTSRWETTGILDKKLGAVVPACLGGIFGSRDCTMALLVNLVAVDGNTAGRVLECDCVPLA